MRKAAFLLFVVAGIVLFVRADLVFGVRHLFALATEPSDAVIVLGKVIQTDRYMITTHKRGQPYRVDYTFVADGKSVMGSDVAFGNPPDPGHRIRVSYSPSNPARNRIPLRAELQQATIKAVFSIAFIVIGAVIALRPPRS